MLERYSFNRGSKLPMPRVGDIITDSEDGTRCEIVACTCKTVPTGQGWPHGERCGAHTLMLPRRVQGWIAYEATEGWTLSGILERQTDALAAPVVPQPEPQAKPQARPQFCTNPEHETRAVFAGSEFFQYCDTCKAEKRLSRPEGWDSV